MKKFRNFAMLKPGPPCADASDSCTPNHTSIIVARAMQMWSPSASIDGAAVVVNESHP